MILDEEVFAVIMAISIVASAVGIALVIPRNPEPFTALGLLNEEGKIGEYPKEVYVNRSFKLHVFISNHLGYTALFSVKAKLGRGEIPTNETPLNTPVLAEKYALLCHQCNTTIPFELRLSEAARNETLVFELYQYNPGRGIWEYTGRYVFLRINVTEVLPVGK